SSGSPVLDSSGKVIGIATLVLRGGQSLNFAIPVEVAVEMLHSQDHKRPRAIAPLQQLALLDALDDKRTQIDVVVRISSLLDFIWLRALKSTNSESLAMNPDEIQPLRTIVFQTPVDWEEALNRVKTLAAKYPNSGAVYAMLGLIYNGMGFPDDAIR